MSNTNVVDDLSAKQNALQNTVQTLISQLQDSQTSMEQYKKSLQENQVKTLWKEQMQHIINQCQSLSADMTKGGRKELADHLNSIVLKNLTMFRDRI